MRAYIRERARWRYLGVRVILLNLYLCIGAHKEYETKARCSGARSGNGITIIRLSQYDLGLIVRLLCGNSAVIVRLLCGYCAVIVRLLCGYCAVIVRCGPDRVWRERGSEKECVQRANASECIGNNRRIPEVIGGYQK